MGTRLNMVMGQNGYPLGVANPTGSRVVATATATSTAEAALPINSAYIELRAVEAIWIRFGNTGMGVAAADANSVLFTPGEKVMPVPLNPTTQVPYDYFRCMRIGAADVPVQIERLNSTQE